jgi:hypothetical protein
VDCKNIFVAMKTQFSGEATLVKAKSDTYNYKCLMLVPLKNVYSSITVYISYNPLGMCWTALKIVPTLISEL